jgi:hypothetical protein
MQTSSSSRLDRSRGFDAGGTCQPSAYSPARRRALHHPFGMTPRSRGRCTRGTVLVADSLASASHATEQRAAGLAVISQRGLDPGAGADGSSDEYRGGSHTGANGRLPTSRQAPYPLRYKASSRAPSDYGTEGHRFEPVGRVRKDLQTQVFRCSGGGAARCCLRRDGARRITPAHAQRAPRRLGSDGGSDSAAPPGAKGSDLAVTPEFAAHGQRLHRTAVRSGTQRDRVGCVNGLRHAGWVGR